MKRIFWLGIALFITIIAIAPASRSVAQTDVPESERKRYFPQTGHILSGDFLFAWESVSDPYLIYGNPITEPFQDESSGRLFQYFERARFELYPENPPELRVTITPLGYFTQRDPSEFNPLGATPGCRFFSEYRKSVCYDFLEFFDTYGGVAQFGYPITNFAVEDGWIVQYFQRARFEWHPELSSGLKVRLTDLGSKYFWLIGENPKRLLPVKLTPEDELVNVITGLTVRATTANATTHTSGTQKVFVTVHDQKLVPVLEAAVSIEVTFPSGDILVSPGQMLTDANGIVSYQFSFAGQRPGLATIKVAAEKAGYHQETVTSYLIWW